MNREKYVQLPIRRESRSLLKDMGKVLKLKYDKYMGYDRVIEELVRMYKEHDEFVRNEMKLIEANTLVLSYAEKVEVKR